jgi:hypothetical protein
MTWGFCVCDDGPAVDCGIARHRDEAQQRRDAHALSSRLMTLVCQCGHPETGTSDGDVGRKMHAHQVDAAMESGGSS